MNARWVHRWAAAVIGAVAAFAVPSASAAPPGLTPATPPPLRYDVDERGVDLISGAFKPSQTILSIGQPGAGGLSEVYEPTSPSNRYPGKIIAYKVGTDWAFRVTIKDVSTSFLTTYASVPASFTVADSEGQGAKLTLSGTTYLFNDGDGVEAEFNALLIVERHEPDPVYISNRVVALITQISQPNGARVTYFYQKHFGEMSGLDEYFEVRLQSITNNFGYQIKYEYAGNSISDLTLWYRRSKVTLINNAVDYCNPTSDTCTGFTQTWPKIDFTTGTGTTLTDLLGRATTYVIGAAGGTTTITMPGSIVITVQTDANNRVTSWSNGTQTYTYADADDPSSIDPNIRIATVTGPESYSRTVTYDSVKRIVFSDKDSLNRTTSYTYDAFNRLTRVTAPEDNYTQYGYDSRGNITTTTTVAKPSLPLTSIVTSANYTVACGALPVPVTCYKPNWTEDAKGHRTDYTYDPDTADLLTVTAPAATGGGVRPKITYTYELKTAWIKIAVGSSTVLAQPAVTRLVSTSTCTTSTSCAGAAEEVKSTITYQAGVTGGSNLLPLNATAGSGNGALTAETKMTYDAISNLDTVDGPIAGANDKTKFRYDVMRRQIGVAGPDPDLTGALKHRAVRITYNVTGNPWLTERGTVDSLSDPDWANFAVLETQTATYDTLARPIKAAFMVSGTTYAVVQTAYDAAGRISCTAQRMNPAVFASLPSSACTLGTQGANGPDRIARIEYYASSEVWKQIRGYATAAPITEVTATYTANGMTQTVKDGRGNLTTYEYDGFDRLAKLSYPENTATPSGASSDDDYELYTYDDNSLLATMQRRFTTTPVTYTYDNLNRLIGQSIPAGRAYTYDLLGRMTSSAATGQTTLQWSFDALGRATSKTDALGTWGYQYDLVGRRTKITWPTVAGATALDVDYNYNLTGEMTRVRENGATSGIGVLAAYAYDDLGRRTRITRGNTTSTNYAYDAASRLSDLTLNLVGSTNDFAKTFAYNPAGQILSQTLVNASYIYSGTTPGGSYTNNGLNQVTNALGSNILNDTKGNLVRDAVRTYAYDAMNRLICVRAGTSACNPAPDMTLRYDPMDRLAETVTGGGTTRFVHDGGEITGEYTGTDTIARRYVKGAGADETLVWYEGSGITDRRWLHADERGSIVAISNDAGNSTAINTFDEYGRPGAGNTGRFQYTGQAWVGEIGLYYYKARFYNPALGRFMQTDPIGYGGGMNLYAYVGGDPVNATDPSGLWKCGFWTQGGCTRAGGAGAETVIVSAAIENARALVSGLREAAFWGGSPNEPGPSDREWAMEECPPGTAPGTLCAGEEDVVRPDPKPVPPNRPVSVIGCGSGVGLGSGRKCDDFTLLWENAIVDNLCKYNGIATCNEEMTLEELVRQKEKRILCLAARDHRQLTCYYSLDVGHEIQNNEIDRGLQNCQRIAINKYGRCTLP